MSDTIRVFIAEDQAIVRKGIRALLATEPDLTVVGEATSGEEAVEAVLRARPDVILMDLVMPGVDGIEATRQITSSLPDARILILTSFATDDKIFPAIKAGALGYLLKDSSPQELVQSIRQIHRGEASLHPVIARKVLLEVRQEPQIEGSPHTLTAREVEVLRLVARGFSNADIADVLSLSPATVRTHVSTILGKLHLASRTQAALYALREGLATLDEKDPS